MKKKLLIAFCGLLLISGCGNAKLKDGDTDLVTFKDKKAISTNDLYKKLKDQYGAQTLTNVVDELLLEDLYDSTTEEKQYVNQQVKTVKDAAKKMGVTTDVYLYYYYGVQTEKEFKEQLTLDYRRNLYASDYAKESVTEKQINDYYEKEVIGDIEASQILISVEKVDEDKETEAKENAKKKANEVIKKLKNGEDFAKLAQEYSDDSLTANKGGSLGKVNKEDVSEEIINALISLKDGTYTTTPVESTTGYYILYRTSQSEKAKLDDALKEKITSAIADETVESNANYKFTAMKALRTKNEMKIKDSSLNSDFEDLHKSY